MTPQEKILIVDFGSQVTQLIARRVRENGVYCEIQPFNRVDADSLAAYDPKAVILSGGPASVSAAQAPRAPDAVFESGLPVLGICYGMQLLAAVRGGTLVYDIPTDRPQAGPHRLPEADGRHPLQIEVGTRLCDALGPDSPPVNSLHHQAVADPGDRLRVAARSPDGLIEAIELVSYGGDGGDAGFCLGVQWHPEKMRGSKRNLLFSAFVAACARAQENVENA